MEHEHHHPLNESPSKEETLALLRYMAQHNIHHADELSEIVPALPDLAAKEIEVAAALIRQSAEMIKKAIRKTEG